MFQATSSTNSASPGASRPVACTEPPLRQRTLSPLPQALHAALAAQWQGQQRSGSSQVAGQRGVQEFLGLGQKLIEVNKYLSNHPMIFQWSSIFVPWIVGTCWYTLGLLMGIAMVISINWWHSSVHTWYPSSHPIIRNKWWDNWIIFPARKWFVIFCTLWWFNVAKIALPNRTE